MIRTNELPFLQRVFQLGRNTWLIIAYHSNFSGMNWKTLCLLAALLICFGFPVLSGTQLPEDYSAEQVGGFLGQIATYWISVFGHIIRKIGFPF